MEANQLNVGSKYWAVIPESLEKDDWSYRVFRGRLHRFIKSEPDCIEFRVAHRGATIVYYAKRAEVFNTEIDAKNHLINLIKSRETSLF